MPGPHLKYRADIDGLRALAILSVVDFHAFPVTFKGGLTGVDIFSADGGHLSVFGGEFLANECVLELEHLFQE